MGIASDGILILLTFWVKFYGSRSTVLGYTSFTSATRDSILTANTIVNQVGQCQYCAMLLCVCYLIQQVSFNPSARVLFVSIDICLDLNLANVSK